MPSIRERSCVRSISSGARGNGRYEQVLPNLPQDCKVVVVTGEGAGFLRLIGKRGEQHNWSMIRRRRKGRRRRKRRKM